MTTIAAKRTILPSGKRSVRIAWDSQATGQTISREITKVRAINDQFAVGGAGHLRWLNIVHRASVDQIHPADIVRDDFDAEGWLITELVPAWGHAVQKAISSMPRDEDQEAPHGTALVVLAGSIFEIGGYDYSVANMGASAAIGSGGQYALAAMHIGKSAAKAVEVASQLDLYTGGTIKEMEIRQ